MEEATTQMFTQENPVLIWSESRVKPKIHVDLLPEKVVLLPKLDPTVFLFATLNMWGQRSSTMKVQFACRWYSTTVIWEIETVFGFTCSLCRWELIYVFMIALDAECRHTTLCFEPISISLFYNFQFHLLHYCSPSQSRANKTHCKKL